MQKILRRVATTERVAAKRSRKLKDSRERREAKAEKQNFGQQRQVIKKELDTAKAVVKEDWRLGPLARKLDIGENDRSYGSINEARYMTSGSRQMSLDQRNARCKWAGGVNRLNLHAGDRVVLLEGPDKGRIGKIGSIDLERATLMVDGLNKTNVRAPPYLRSAEAPANYTLELPMPISSVRLVHPVRDPATGITKDVIINQIVATEFFRDRVTGKERWTRMVPGLNMSIPWPAKEVKEVKEHAGDTLRINVEQRTFIPTLLRPPMPETVLDELRGKYSRFRTRHEPEYIAAKEAEVQAVKDRAKLMDSIRTPLQELHRHERSEKKKKGKPRLTPEMLEEIGKVIAKNRERTLNAAAISSVEPAETGEAVSPPPAATVVEPTPENTATPPPSS